ncbi:YicC/YloC family endoribonuclease [Pontibaca salina]|uniref:YicC family protein n=1 Tax=Pontibaca salina TaxID=2795731 RepID=A0A934HKU3_9RHOB|nr:YicC/YloC family endoribonuclease [Pontibaca salina]MBI6630034.1 YicC family protein [Pontibaca salina]
MTPIRSMTGFASGRGEQAHWFWSWELRSVNARGLDLRLRVPDWLEGLEQALRGDLGQVVTRGNVSLTLRVTRNDTAGTLSLDRAALGGALDALATVEAEAMDRGITLGPSRAVDLLALPGVLNASALQDDTAPLVAALRKQFAPLVADFVQMRESEGTALAVVMHEQLNEIGELTDRAAKLSEARKDAMAEALRSNLARVLNNSDGADPDRVAQELAMLAVKSDVTEEIDRLHTHVAATRDLLTTGGAIGRKLDFLMQEFNREANTLCSKAQSGDLTAVGLELKAVIDRMREQVQNIE